MIISRSKYIINTTRLPWRHQPYLGGKYLQEKHWLDDDVGGAGEDDDRVLTNGHTEVHHLLPLVVRHEVHRADVRLLQERRAVDPKSRDTF